MSPYPRGTQVVSRPQGLSCHLLHRRAAVSRDLTLEAGCSCEPRWQLRQHQSAERQRQPGACYSALLGACCANLGNRWWAALISCRRQGAAIEALRVYARDSVCSMKAG